MRVAGGGVALVDVADVEDRLGGEQLRPLERQLLLMRPSARSAAPASNRAAAPAPGRAREAWIFASLSPCCAFLTRLGTRFSRLSRSASISSVSTVSASATGSTRPSTWVTSPPSKQRRTWTIASTSRMLPRNWLPSPSPLRRAAHQAGDVDELQLGLDHLRRLGDLGDLAASRGSGTATRPTLGSIVQNG